VGGDDVNSEYREVLRRWAAENVPDHLGIVKILGVELVYEKGCSAWSDVTPGEEPSFGFLIRYSNASGQELTWDSTYAVDAAETERTMSQLLTELFRIADLPG